MKKITIILLIFSALTLTTCKKLPELKVYELNLANENVAYSQTSAEITVDYEYPTQLQYVNVTMSRSNYFDYSFVARAEVKDSVLIANFVDLQTDKNYYYKFEYSNGVNVVTSDVRSFYLDAANVTLPTVITMEVHEVQGNTAVGGGEIIDDGGYYVTARGVCWSTHRNPTIFDQCTTDGMDTGSYTSIMTGLSEHTVYYVRAFAINEKGTSYGTEYSFETTTGGGGGGVVNLPTVITYSVTNITESSAYSGGEVTSDGGSTVTARGVCWSTSENPTINGTHTADGTGTGTFTSSLTNLTPQTIYYVRAYATNEAGTAYGEQKVFATTQELPEAPTGAIRGLFTINENGDQVWFSQGNLQYQASTNTWRFAENQWEYVGEDNTNVSETYTGWIDLFAWGTSGYNHGAANYQPWSTSIYPYDYYAYDSTTSNLNDQTGQADWGFNAIANGDNTTNTWRTMTNEEWGYVLNTRNTNSGIRYSKAVINGTNGIILLPDVWNENTFILNSTNTQNAQYNTNVLSSNAWETLNNAGAVFLPAAGWRDGVNVNDINAEGAYWSTTRVSEHIANSAEFGNNYIFYGDDAAIYLSRCTSVRLVRNAE